MEIQNQYYGHSAALALHAGLGSIRHRAHAGRTAGKVTIGQSEVRVGTFSTSPWEAAALGRPTYVISVPGYEETLQDIESGLFRLAASPHDLIPYEVPELRHTIFDHGQ